MITQDENNKNFLQSSIETETKWLKEAETNPEAREDYNGDFELVTSQEFKNELEELQSNMITIGGHKKINDTINNIIIDLETNNMYIIYIYEYLLNLNEYLKTEVYNELTWNTDEMFELGGYDPYCMTDEEKLIEINEYIDNLTESIIDKTGEEEEYAEYVVDCLDNDQKLLQHMYLYILNFINNNEKSIEEMYPSQ